MACCFSLVSSFAFIADVTPVGSEILLVAIRPRTVAQRDKRGQGQGIGVVVVVPTRVTDRDTPAGMVASLDLCGRESGEAWQGIVDDLKARGLRAPLLAVIDGNPGLRQALGRT